MTELGLSWAVEYPDCRERGAIGARPARARLRISTPERGEEALCIPVAVGRRLDARLAEKAPSCRAELLHDLAECSRSCAHARMEDLVGRRDFSARELTEKLRSYGYGADVVGDLVERARETGLVDDARYGAAFARSKSLAGWGRIKVERELARRGVSASDVPGWPDEFFDVDEERERALALARRRRLTGRNDYQRLVRLLCARGFPMGVCISVAREVVKESGDPDPEPPALD